MNTADTVVMAVFAACGGCVMALAGLTGLRQTRRIEQTGVRAWALVKPNPEARDEDPPAPRPLLRFSTEAGQVVEIGSPVPATRRQPLRDGDTLLITYDPADPSSIVVHNRERRLLDYAFVAAGTLVLLLALVLGSLAAP
ncbi:DUF3592 domain-containing protein [Streptomyces kebangsaanensis]|uniref:DUF3592 domain-containing protein n=1 Tax=Streptomyces kebangsaanensis TaxID=864058 RepID=UPI0009A109D9|nr:DUF3592 domain-containing protein [Streptomyces kebangsaanensis]